MMRWFAVALFVLLVLCGCEERVRFSGNIPVSERQLTYVVHRPLTSWQQKSTQADLIDAQEAIRSYLDTQGYVWAQVAVAVIENDDQQRIPEFTITPGPRATYGDVRFHLSEDTTQLSTTELHERCQLGEWYTTTAVERSAKTLARSLQMDGHLLATVEPAKITWNEQLTVADLDYTITTGPTFTLASERIVFNGDENVREALTAELDAPGTRCHPRLASNTAAKLRGVLLARGYQAATVDGQQRIIPDSNQVEIQFTIHTGPLHIVRHLTTSGGKRTRPAFLKRELGKIKEGQPLSQPAVDQAVSKLLQTGLFRKVHSEVITDKPQPDGSIPTDVAIALQERDSKHFDFSIGYGSYEQLRGGVAYVDDHLFGRGIRFNTGVNASLKHWGADVGLSDPFLLGAGRRLRIDSNYSEREHPSFYRHETKATVGVRQHLHPTFDPVLYEADLRYEFGYSEDFRIQAPLPGEEDGHYLTSTIGLALSRDARRPKIVDPDNGTYLRIGAALSSSLIGSEVEYAEFRAEWSGAYAPAPWLVGALRLRGTTRYPLDSDSLPIGERLFTGGDNTVRSFTKDDLGPRDVNGHPQGGLTSAVANIELRWRLFRTWPQIEIATFYDVGMVDEDPFSSQTPFGQGIGGGLRYRTPVGPIRLDGAYNPGDQLGAKHPWAIHLAVGFAF